MRDGQESLQVLVSPIDASHLSHGWLDGKERPADRDRGDHGEHRDAAVEFVFRHPISAGHEGVRLDVVKRVEIGADAGEQLLDVLADAVWRERPGGRGSPHRVLAADPVDRPRLKALLQVDEHEATKQRRTSTSSDIAVLCFAHTGFGDAPASYEGTEGVVAGFVVRCHLPARVADEKDGTALIQQGTYALIVLDPAVHQLHIDPLLCPLMLIEAGKRNGLEQSGHARRGSNGPCQREMPILRGSFLVVHAPQAIIAVDLRIDAGRRLAHIARGELPVVPRVQGRGVEHDDRNLRRPRPVMRRWREILRPIDRPHDQIRHRTVRLAIPGPRQELVIAELRDAIRTRVVSPPEGHLQVGPEAGDDARADIGLYTLEKYPRQTPHEIEIVFVRDLLVPPGLQEMQELEIVLAADDRAARNARNDLDVPQRVQFREAREYTDVKQRRTEATARERQAHFPDQRRLDPSRIAGSGKRLEHGPARKPGIGPARLGGFRVTYTGHRSELTESGFDLPGIRVGRASAFHPGRGVLILAQPEVRLGDGDQEPPVRRETGAVGHSDESRQLSDYGPADVSGHLTPLRGGLGSGARIRGLFRFLERKDIEDECGIDRRVPEVLRDALLVAARVVAGGSLEVYLLAEGFPLVFVDGAGQSQRLLLLRAEQIVDFTQNRQRLVEAYVSGEVGVFVRAERLLLTKERAIQPRWQSGRGGAGLCKQGAGMSEPLHALESSRQRDDVQDVRRSAA